MEEVFARREMLSRDRLRELSARSNLRGFIQVGSHLGAIVLTGIALLLTWGTWWAVPVFILHGVLLNFLYAGQHELSHATVFTSKGLNEWLGRAFGFLLIYPRDFDQIQHFAHHRFTSVWGQDGELQRPPYDMRSYLLWMLGPTYWYSRIARIFRLSSGKVIEYYIPERRKADVIREARYHLAGYAIIAVASFATGSWAAVTYWIAPMFLTKVVHQLQNTIEHLRMSRTRRSTPVPPGRTRSCAGWRGTCSTIPPITRFRACPATISRASTRQSSPITDADRRR